MADVLIGREARPVGLAKSRAFARRLFDWTAIGAAGAFVAYLLQFAGG